MDDMRTELDPETIAHLDRMLSDPVTIKLIRESSDRISRELDGNAIAELVERAGRLTPEEGE